MEATAERFVEFLRKSSQLVIPIYQRAYSWTDRECKQLWDDIIRAGETDAISAHFLGSIVYIEQGLYQVSSQTTVLVIDGQQRLTTVTLLLAALAESIPDGDEPYDGFSERKIRNRYLTNPDEDGESFFKLILSDTDRKTLIAILKGVEPPVNQSVRISQNYDLFLDLIKKNPSRFNDVCAGVAKLMLVDISLTRDQDNPQLIFESMNSTGRELSQADLIRNYVLMSLDHELQKRLYEDLWRPMELDFGQEAYQKHFDSFMRHYLTLKTGVIPKIQHVYEAFKSHSESEQTIGHDTEHVLKDVRKYSKYFCRMALGTETDNNLNMAFQDLRDFRVEVAYPLLLQHYTDYDDGLITKDELLEVVRLIEAYVFRRAVCSIPTNSLNKTFSTFSASIDKENYVESVSAAYCLLNSYRRFPSDDEFQRNFESADLYSFARRSYWLRRFENHGRKERVPVDHYTIEHILPQNEKLSTGWKVALGENWEQIQKKYLHTLGNLTLTGYNAEYSDHDFSQKRDMEGGFAESPLKLNKGLGQLANWDEDQIIQRAKQLSREAIDVWKYPQIEDSRLNRYRQDSTKTRYDLTDHEYLNREQVRGLFETLRKEVISLDPNVTEEVLKLYVAYKAETNFLDVEPQAHGLRLYLNMPYPEVDDPKRISKDMSNVGHWGNGDVEIRLANESEIPYAMGLVRQSFERQMELVE